MEIQRYLVRVDYRGRIHYLYTDAYDTAVLAGQAIYDNSDACVSIYNGATMLWQDNRPCEVSG